MVSLAVTSGILKFVWAVAPPSGLIGSIPEEKQGRQTLPPNFDFVMSVLAENVFPDPPGASQKNFAYPTTSFLQL